MIGKTVSHYRILDKLGEGGMGVVYKAQDTKLERMVALKFLPPELTRDAEAKERFVHEAQAASALDHPNICNVHEIGETDEGQLFIAMSCYEGETLKSRIQRGPLALGEAVRVVLQVAEGLAKAHVRGIVHRDVKPANIILTPDGTAKILDFGLAKLAGHDRLTKISSTLGTTAYMSPEQAKGEELDQRTDIWSLGVVFFEMLTGKLPFQGEHEAALLYSIVHEEPQALSTLKPGIPPLVSSVVSRALQKDPARRYQTAEEMAADLTKLSSLAGRPTREQKSIVVLPFENLSSDPEQEYFSDGLTEEVISDLSSAHALRVISRSSAMTFKGTKKKVPDIARELDVQYVLEGSVRTAGSSLRITAQLIDATNDAHLWADKYSGTLDDVFAIQEKVSRSIVDALKIKLTPQESRKMAERPIDNFAAYQCYLRANAAAWRFTVDALDSAHESLQKAIEILGDNALVYSAMAFLYWQYVNLGAAQEDYIAKAKGYARKALALDADSPQAHYIMGMIHGAFGSEVRESLRELKTALALDPTYTDPMIPLVWFYALSVGKLDEAASIAERNKRLDPLSPWIEMHQAALCFYDGRYEDALETHRRAYTSDPANPMRQFWYALTLTYSGDRDAAFSIIDQANKATPENVCTKFGLLLKYSLLKDKEKALALLTPDFRKTCERDHQWSYFVGLTLASGDARDEALDWLENAVNRGFCNYPDLSRNPYFDGLRGEERFKKLLEKTKHEWEHFEV